ncbi:hypothetical protein TPENAI_50222 [Tenacibaculum litopenaei]|uniref:hypothetical protein n=1 Tax=Tenacibaculum litopenaei TaxID=396016 RepID=UPI0038932DE0
MDEFVIDLLDKKRERKETGLTIPFLIGALRRRFENENIDIAKLLSLFMEVDKTLVLKFCFHIREYIITTDNIYVQSLNYYKSVSSFNNFILIKDNGSLVGIENFEDIVYVLNLDYEDSLKEGNYSVRVNNHEKFMSKFDDDDLKFIDSIN